MWADRLGYLPMTSDGTFLVGWGDLETAFAIRQAREGFTDSRFGISLTGLRDDDVVRTDINITNNVFDNMERSALKIDKPSTGTFADNILIESEAVIVKGEGFDAPYAVGTNLALTAEQAIAPAPLTSFTGIFSIATATSFSFKAA